jgi:hypothetical protein
MTDINEEIDRLRKKMHEAIRIGFMDEEQCGTYEMTLLQIMSEADRQRRNCINRADQLKMQAATAEGQGAAFGMISSIINNVVASLIHKTTQMAEEEKQLAEQEAKANEEEEKPTVAKKKIAKRKVSRKKVSEKA